MRAPTHCPPRKTLGASRTRARRRHQGRRQVAARARDRQGTSYDRIMSQGSEVLYQSALARAPWARRMSDADLLTVTEDLHYRLQTNADRGAVLADVFALGL